MLLNKSKISVPFGRFTLTTTTRKKNLERWTLHKRSHQKIKCGGNGLGGESEMDYEAKEIGLRRKIDEATCLLWGKSPWGIPRDENS